ncbi:MAG TPA: HAD-IC family P-type ATPase, partial [Phaeodactylibacter sp.]|nr:HAD-IC family P-type ATPase [Phaeodactylibacter sp.]
MKPPYTQAVPEVATALHADLEAGLTTAEARLRLQQYGPNLLEKQQQKSLWRILLDQFASPIVWLLIGAAALAFVFGEVPEGTAIVIVILINTLIGFFMEWQALRSMQELRKMGRAKSTVWRSGKQQQIDSVQLVPGDLLLLQAGDLVTADARLVEQHNLAVKESALTGESVQEHKHTRELPPQTPLADRDNSVYKGTVVTRGNGKAIVVATGKHTELGKIAELAQTAEKEATPLDKRLNQLSRKLIWLTLVITLIIFLAGVARGSDWLLMIETAIALAVAALPEGLPIIATITLAMGMVLLARKNAIVKTLRAVQTLGETNVIFTDKTGTLTENDMYLEMATLAEGRIRVSASPQNGQPPQDDKLELLLKIGALCNDATYTPATGASTGDPIEIALLRTVKAHEELRKQYPRRAEIPFDAELKMMGTVHLTPKGKYLVCAKGATEAILKQCRHMVAPDGARVPLTDKTHWLNQVDELAAEGYRVLSFAYRESQELPGEQGFLHDLVFLGLGGFIDPARKEVKEAVESCKEAGIKVVMVTGDHPETAGHIAEQVGIVEDGRAAIKIHGNELREDGGDEAYRNRLVSTHIFARTNPAQKL